MTKAVGTASSRATHAGEKDREQRIEPGIDHRREERVAAEPDEGLLADRDEAGIAGEQVPVLRQRQPA